MTTDIRVPTRVVELHANAGESFDPDDGPWDIHGIAVAAGDVLHTADGTPVLMTERELRKAAASQSDQPLSNGHPIDEDGKPIYPPPPDETAGKVTNADYLDGQGVGFAASVHDPAIARGLHAGNFDVSVHPKFEFGDRDPKTGAVIAENIRFQDLATVSKGDAPSNTAQWGPSSELLAYVHSGGIVEALTAAASSIHKPTFSSTTTANWDKPSLSDLAGTSDWGDLSAEEQRDVSGHFLVSVSGFPPDDFGDLKLPVVEPSGALNVNALASAKSYLGRTEGISDDQADRLESMINTLANENFEDASFDTEGESTASLWRRLGTRLGLTVEQVSDEGAESPSDANEEVNSMTTREKQIQTLVSDHGFDEDTLEPMADEQLTAMYSRFIEDLDPEPDDPNDTNVVELDIGEHDDAASFIAEQAQEAVATATEATEREELIAQITAAKDMTADDLEDTPTAVLKELAPAATESAELPGATGRNTGTVVASVGADDDDDLDAYGTGVH